MRGLLIKSVIGIAGLGALVFFGSIDFSVLIHAAERPGLLILAFLCMVATVPISAFRWWVLLRGLAFRLSLTWSISTSFVSIFFSTFLPGAYGGDLVRLAIAVRAAGKGTLNRLTFSVIADRLAGLMALLILAVALVPLLPADLAERLEWIAAFAVAAGIAGLVFALSTGDLFSRLARRLPSPIGPKLGDIIAELTTALRAYVARPTLIATAVATSIFQWLFVIAALVILGTAMRFEGLSWSGYATAGVWSLVANALPITPGGIGVGEAAFAQVASMLSSLPAQAAGYGTVFLAMRVLSTLLGVIAIVPWLLHRSELRHGLSTMQTEEVTEPRTRPATE